MLTGDLCVGRVIARPFVGEKAGAFQRTSGRRDFSVEPFSRTLLDAVKAYARQDLERFFQIKVNLHCWVKVKEDWRNREGLIHNFGLDNK